MFWIYSDTSSLPHVYAPQYALDTALDLNFAYYIEVPVTFGGALDDATFMPWWELYKSCQSTHPHAQESRPLFESHTTVE